MPKDCTIKIVPSNCRIQSISRDIIKNYWKDKPWFYKTDSENIYKYLEQLLGTEPFAMARASNPECDDKFRKVLQLKDILKTQGIHLYSWALWKCFIMWNILFWKQMSTPLFGMFLPMISSYLGSLTSTLTWVAVMNPWALGCFVFCTLWLLTYLKQSENVDTSKIVKQLVQSSAQWNTSSQQDSNQILALMHAN